VTRRSTCGTGPAGDLRQTLETVNEGLVQDIAFSPEGDLLAVGCHNGTIQFWRTDTYGEPESLEAFVLSPVVRIAFDPNHAILVSAHGDGTLRLWNVAEGTLLSVLDAHSSRVNGLAFNADGAVLISSGDDSIMRMWDVLAE
jgi:WD40 repeat protein